MPDLINPELTDDIEFIRWADELCSSCKEKHCPLITVLTQSKIMTFSGIHVSNCDLYDPDTESEHYLPPDADQDKINAANIETIKQGLSELRKLMDTIDSVKDEVG